MSGYINFNADIIANAMEVPILKQARLIEDPLPEDENLFVNMGAVSESAFSVIGSTAGSVMFQLRINNTSQAKTVRIVFDGMPAAVDRAVLATTNSTIGITLGDEAGNNVALLEGREYPLQPGQNVLRFTGRLMAIKESVMPGSLGALATYTLSYK